METGESPEAPPSAQVRLAAAHVLLFGDSIVRLILAGGIILLIIGSVLPQFATISQAATWVSGVGLVLLMLIPVSAIAVIIVQANVTRDRRSLLVSCAVLAMLALSVASALLR